MNQQRTEKQRALGRRTTSPWLAGGPDYSEAAPLTVAELRKLRGSQTVCELDFGRPSASPLTSIHTSTRPVSHASKVDAPVSLAVSAPALSGGVHDSRRGSRTSASPMPPSASLPQIIVTNQRPRLSPSRSSKDPYDIVLRQVKDGLALFVLDDRVLTTTPRVEVLESQCRLAALHSTLKVMLKRTTTRGDAGSEGGQDQGLLWGYMLLEELEQRYEAHEEAMKTLMLATPTHTPLTHTSLGVGVPSPFVTKEVPLASPPRHSSLPSGGGRHRHRQSAPNLSLPRDVHRGGGVVHTEGEPDSSADGFVDIPLVTICTPAPVLVTPSVPSISSTDDDGPKNSKAKRGIARNLARTISAYTTREASWFSRKKDKNRTESVEVEDAGKWDSMRAGWMKSSPRDKPATAS